MIQPQGNSYRPVTSHDQIYQAMTNAEIAMEGYGVSQAGTAENLAGLQDNISQREQTEAHHFAGLAKQDAKDMQIALGVGAFLTFLGAATLNSTEFGGPDSSDDLETAVGKAKDLNDKAMVAGTFTESLGEATTSMTQAVTQANAAKAKGKLTQTQTAATLSEQIAKRAQDQEVAAWKASSEVAGSLSSFIAG